MRIVFKNISFYSSINLVWTQLRMRFALSLNTRSFVDDHKQNVLQDKKTRIAYSMYM